MYISTLKENEVEKTLHDLIKKKLKYFYILKMNIRFNHLNSNLNLSDVQKNDRVNQFCLRNVSICACFTYTICFGS